MATYYKQASTTLTEGTNKAFAPIVQKFQVATEGGDTDFTAEIKKRVEPVSRNGIKILTLKAELFNGKASLCYNSVISTLFEDRRIEAVMHDDDGTNIILGNTLFHDFNLFAQAFLPTPTTTESAHTAEGMPLYEYLFVNSAARSGFGVYTIVNKSNEIYPQTFLTLFDTIRVYDGLNKNSRPLLSFTTHNYDSGMSRVAIRKISGGLAKLVGGSGDVDNITDALPFPCNRYRHYSFQIEKDETYDSIELLRLTGGSGFLRLDVKKIEHCDTPAHPFYVRWINSMGGWDYWMFTCKQLHAMERKSSTSVELYDEMNERKRVTIAQELAETITASTGSVSSKEFHPLSLILYSPKIQHFDMVQKKWVNVQVEKGSVETITNSSSSEMTLQFTLPTPTPQV